MNLKSIQALYEYDRWANARVFDAASKLSVEQFRKDLGSSYPSIRDTLTHVLSAEWLYLQRWKGTSPKSMWSAEDFASVGALKARWAVVEQEQRDFVQTLTEERLGTVIHYLNLKGESFGYPLWVQMLHLVNHSTYHRGQIATLLRQLGAKPLTTDLLVFYDEAGPRIGAMPR